ncbi:hypothetical protein PR001_g14628 [Phytophthora rubi]|uniref:Secreted protein n=1 Tax=Phytophthora rubi TaxID=129364 RepID=A0A6A3LBX3_9STRA|nr:hypothetical protein PR001_g14628 [Phytophthora rubi]KAE9048565.1 hypothetical protein PR002_g396 [Phytophthora rubi]
MYDGVPQKFFFLNLFFGAMSSAGSSICGSPQSSKSLKPKSMMVTCPELSSCKIFSSFKSRWITRCA